jgi:hypothetical protein
MNDVGVDLLSLPLMVTNRRRPRSDRERRTSRAENYARSVLPALGTVSLTG